MPNFSLFNQQFIIVFGYFTAPQTATHTHTQTEQEKVEPKVIFKHQQLFPIQIWEQERKGREKLSEGMKD
jgi:hypothetical protein